MKTRNRKVGKTVQNYAERTQPVTPVGPRSVETCRSDQKKRSGGSGKIAKTNTRNTLGEEAEKKRAPQRRSVAFSQRWMANSSCSPGKTDSGRKQASDISYRVPIKKRILESAESEGRTCDLQRKMVPRFSRHRRPRLKAPSRRSMQQSSKGGNRLLGDGQRKQKREVPEHTVENLLLEEPNKKKKRRRTKDKWVV